MGWGKRSIERSSKKKDRQIWSRDRMKEKGHITVNKTKTKKKKHLVSMSQLLKNTPLHESRSFLSALLKSAERGESQYTLELGEANSNKAMLGQIEQAALWDRLIMGKEERRG